ncbi:hypothetical protein M407DRAFT_26608 [Tulasnella calospora MUT 4182]|uniref:Protein kinase domain-containing protein n=1 Tax=Tulasnella calospora MUT 4182 TaxID=1051891 RepID=A0A0C3KRD5_9AGAM|nr:hypothetical protein M407DRAFT_26608 [Tulasnella calospora MUT 4182]
MAENVDTSNDGTAHGGAIIESSGEAMTKTPARERLDGLSSFRIHPAAIKFSSPDPHGSGGMANVARATYSWEDWDDEQVVAVKKVRYHQGVEKKKFENEFVHEVEVMAGLSHKNILQMIGFIEDLENGIAWIVLSWVPNGNVSEFLAVGDWEIPERISLVSDSPP